ncbi:MAG: hypothetical protein ACLP8A_12295 [Methylovirgula sp.]
MTDIEIVKKDFLNQTRELLSNHPKELRKFEDLWESGRLREAYVSVKEATEKLGLTPSRENRKTDEDFFWLYMH